MTHPEPAAAAEPRAPLTADELRVRCLELISENNGLRDRLDAIGLLLPVLAGALTGPHAGLRNAELIAKAIAHHQAGARAEEAHHGEHPAGFGQTLHKGPRERCPAPDCLDWLAEQHSEKHRAVEVGVTPTGEVHQRTVFAGDWEDTGMAACPAGAGCTRGAPHDGGLWHPGRGTPEEQMQSYEAWVDEGRATTHEHDPDEGKDLDYD
jgi:hypothetical protein